ncbi:protein phosphatase 1 regulatory subunit 3G [Thalassophryne amazonica]|uniref:protein phosphatase 1 regulatory subunit 3G n=1 Tax=Thalassophryne amazonica TaxID=390379 RepID=UPI001471F38B|nr:protein phosphatase 1 regulatory subunit 3G [Thalassophryne amazonica]
MDPTPDRAFLVEDDPEDVDLEDDMDASQLDKFMKDRRRAKSLPAYPGLLEAEPGANGRKRVKFADSLGLNLASIKHFSAMDDPQVPSKVLSRHRIFKSQDLRSDLCVSLNSGLDTERLVACFPEPAAPEDRVRLFRVCLETISTTHCDVRGQIRVLSGSSDKQVGVRYTFNDWLSYSDVQALPVSVDQPDLVGERFGFTVYTPPFMDPGSALHLAIYLRSEEGEFWDNNGGQNYTLVCRCMARPKTFVSAAFYGT